MKAKNRRRTVPYLALLTAVLLMGGCSGSKALNMTVVGTPNLNSTDETPGGNAAVVRIYQLSNDNKFRTVTLEAFWEDDRAALGNEMVSRQQLQLYPDSFERLEIELEETTRFIGVAADLRRPDHERWREVYALSDLMGKRITVEVSRDRVAITVQ